jgi:Transposase
LPTPTINRWKRDPQARRSLTLHNRGARPIQSEEEVDRKVSLLETEGWKARILKWKELAKEAQLEFEVSSHTVQRHMNERGYRICRACSKIFFRKENINERYAFAALHQPEDYTLSAWVKHVFHDEVHFCLNSRKHVLVMQNETERYHAVCLQNRLERGTNIFHFAGLIRWNWKGPFREIQQTGPEGGYTQVDFERDLNGWILDVTWDRERALGIRNTPKDQRLKLEIDGDSSHGKKKKNSVGRWMLDHLDVVYYFNPGKSLGLSPIEQIWGVMKEYIKKNKPTNAEELLLAIIKGSAT